MNKPTPVKFFAETLGLAPFSLRLKQAKIAILGDEDVPKSKYDLSSLKQLNPKIGIPLWMGKTIIPKKVIISNLFNHTPTPIEEGWSVQTNQALDFRGKHLTYNSHNATDLAVPIGTIVTAPAPGRVASIKSEFNRGGLKIFLDHGNGLMTSCVHLARSLVNTGDILTRGQPMAISGYSGLDGTITFPWGIPHVHFNTWLNSFPTDPFEHHKNEMLQASLWKEFGNANVVPSEILEISQFDAEAVDRVISEIKTESVRNRLQAIQDPYFRGVETMIEMNYYPTRFKLRTNLLKQEYSRKPTLDLPFLPTEFDGIVFMDEM